MVRPWVLFGGLIGGVVGAVLIAALVVGRGGQPEVLTFATLNDEPHVVWLWTESYERAPSEGVFEPGPEQTIEETWQGYDGRSTPETIFAVHTLDGMLLSRGRTVDGSREYEIMEAAERRVWPQPRGHVVVGGFDGDPSWSCRVGLEPVPSERQGVPMCVAPYLGPTTASAASAARPMWPMDLDVVSVREEMRFQPNGLPSSRILRALLEDGSHVVIASQRYHVTILPFSEWESIEALVFGN